MAEPGDEPLAQELPDHAGGQPTPVTGIRPPSPPDFSALSTVGDTWKMFKQKWRNYEVITNLAVQGRQNHVALLLHTLGDDGLRIYNGFHFNTVDEERTVEEILTKFDDYAVGEVNETHERFIFNQRDQTPGETTHSLTHPR